MLIFHNLIYQACFPQRCLFQSEASLSLVGPKQLLKEWYLNIQFPFWSSLILWFQFQAYFLFGLSYRSHCHSNLLCYFKINVTFVFNNKQCSLRTVVDQKFSAQKILGLITQLLSCYKLKIYWTGNTFVIVTYKK